MTEGASPDADASRVITSDPVEEKQTNSAPEIHCFNEDGILTAFCYSGGADTSCALFLRTGLAHTGAQTALIPDSLKYCLMFCSPSDRTPFFLVGTFISLKLFGKINYVFD
ncbi:hypothetical protein V5799_013647 [Amblyomma americanum]|uniref:Uncharacterized protein n=1 Tax=Amblyomma americanum TaxID=6943 RepID=A0AAQ4E5C0_AMBAM